VICFCRAAETLVISAKSTLSAVQTRAIFTMDYFDA